MSVKFTVCALAACIALASATASAKVPEAEAAKLDGELTPMGAVRGANEAGTIPEWSGTPMSEADIQAIKAESPKFEITAQNYEQYKDQLSPGQIAMLQKYPDTFKMRVFDSKRTATFPDRIYGKAKANAVTAELVEGGNGLKNFDETTPFPIPKDGLEVIWNHITRYRGGAVERTQTQAPVKENGNYTLVRVNDLLIWPQYLSDGYDAKKDSNMLFYYKQEVLAPARLTGNVFLVHEKIDQVAEKRSAWVYNAGQRRVRRAPQVAYDSPGFASEGARTSDNLDMYNGAPDRYNWELVGKQEMYIPYNSFGLASKDLKYKDILMKGHANPEHLRYELHRVWVVEASLKDGERHVYAKRRFYIDEDSWQAAVIDHYDGRGKLWRVSEAYKMQYLEPNTPWYAAEGLYDLISGRYMMIGMTNEEKKGFDFDAKAKHGDFTPAALRRAGKR